MKTNPLVDVLTPTIRKYVYAAYALAGLQLGAFAIAGWDTGKEGGVLAYLGAALGLTAASNVKPKGEAGNVDVLLLLAVLTLVGVLLLLFGVKFK